MPRNLSRYLSTIQWETIDTPDEAVELWLIANADDPGQCMPTCVTLSLTLRCPQFRGNDLSTALRDMIREGLVMHAPAMGDEGPYETLVYTGGVWGHPPEDATDPSPAPQPPQAYVVMFGDPMDGYTVYGTWADKPTAEWWARNNVVPGPDWFVVPLTHIYP